MTRPVSFAELRIAVAELRATLAMGREADQAASDQRVLRDLLRRRCTQRLVTMTADERRVWTEYQALKRAVQHLGCNT